MKRSRLKHGLNGRPADVTTERSSWHESLLQHLDYTELSEQLRRPNLCIPLRGSELQPATRSICLALSTCFYLYVWAFAAQKTLTKPAPLSHSHLFQSHNAWRLIFLHLTQGAEGYLFMFAAFSLHFNAPFTYCLAAIRPLWLPGKPFKTNYDVCTISNNGFLQVLHALFTEKPTAGTCFRQITGHEEEKCTVWHIKRSHSTVSLSSEWLLPSGKPNCCTVNLNSLRTLFVPI